MRNFLVILALFSTANISVQLQAQQVYASKQSRTTEQKITISSHGTIRQALTEVAKQANLKLVVDEDFPALARSLSLQLNDVTLAVALKRIMQGAGAVAYVTSNGQTIVVGWDRNKSSKGTSIIVGKVTDSKTGRGISGATVSVGNDVREATTAEDGSYRLVGVPVGARTVTVRLLGYAKQVRSITVGEGVTITADFKLEPTANVLDQVVVTGTVAATELKAVPNAMTIITAKQIEERGITRLEQLFRGDVPGLYAINVMGGTTTDNYGQVALFSRGATALDNTLNSGSTGINDKGPLTNNMKMYVDGVQLSDSGLKFLGQIDPKSIERIEILTGPQASTVYGAGAINGVMQIFTKRGSTSRPQFTLSFQSGMSESNYRKGIELNTYVTNLSLSGLEGRISYRMGTSWNHDASWLAGQQTNTFSSDGGVNISLGSKITATSSARWSRRFSLMKGNPAGATTPLGSLLASGVQGFSFTVAPVNEIAFTSSQGGGLTLNYRQFPWWSHSATVGFDGNSYGRYQPGARYGNIGDTSLSINDRPGKNISQTYWSTMQLPLLSLANLNLTFGGDHTRSDMNNLGWYADKMTGLIKPSNRDFGSQALQSKPYRHSGAYVQGMLGIKDALFFTYGVRADWDPAYGDNADVKPSSYGATFNQSLGSVTAKLRGKYGRSIRAPKRDLTKGQLVFANQTEEISKFGVYYTTLPNPELVPEHQQGGEGGIDLYFGNRGSLSVTRYNQTTDNLIQGFNSDSVRSLLINEEWYSNKNGRIVPFTCAEITALTGGNLPCGYEYVRQRKNLNIGSIRNQGWESQGTLTLGPITTAGSYSWTKSRIIGIAPKYLARFSAAQRSKFQIGAPFQYLPEHTWAFSVRYDNRSSSIGLYLNGQGTKLIPIGSTILGLTTSSDNRITYTRERMGTPQGVVNLAVPGYANADLTASHPFSSRMDATLNVNNLTNYYRNDYNALFPTIGRQTRLGLQWRW